MADLAIEIHPPAVEPAKLRIYIGAAPGVGKTYRMLEQAHLLSKHGVDVVDFDTLIAEVWAPAVVNEETVTQRVKLLRQALGDDGRAPLHRAVKFLVHQVSLCGRLTRGPRDSQPRRARDCAQRRARRRAMSPDRPS